MYLQYKVWHYVLSHRANKPQIVCPELICVQFEGGPLHVSKEDREEKPRESMRERERKLSTP